jgi:hypothetical protein
MSRVYRHVLHVSSAMLHHCTAAKAPIHANRCMAAQRAASHSRGRPLLSFFRASPELHPIPPGPWCASWHTAAQNHARRSSTIHGCEVCKTGLSYCIRMTLETCSTLPASSRPQLTWFRRNLGSICRQELQDSNVSKPHARSSVILPR